MADSVEDLQAQVGKAREKRDAEDLKRRQALDRANEDLERKQLQAELIRLEHEAERDHALATLTGVRAGLEPVVAAVNDDIKAAKAAAKADAPTKEG